ncbi:MAG TPA: hypothetical protein DDX07_05890 [Porphyromonadaceae bacterium]|nr:hypothetical protein [Porphyromonadaceae bacterium]
MAAWFCKYTIYSGVVYFAASQSSSEWFVNILMVFGWKEVHVCREISDRIVFDVKRSSEFYILHSVIILDIWYIKIKKSNHEKTSGNKN